MGYIQERYIIERRGDNEDIEAFVNAGVELFIGDESGHFWFTMDEKEWETFKSFIDAQFKKT